MPSKEDMTIVNVPTEKLVPNSWNPQAMSDVKFNQLLEEIREDGFDEPLLVVPHPDKAKAQDGFFMIVSGEHRWQAMRVLGAAKIPCVVKGNWDEKAQRIKTVRRNMLHGELDKERFSKLVHSLSDTHGVSMRDMASTLGFSNDAEFREQFLSKLRSEEEKKQRGAIQDASDQDRRELEVVDNLSYVINEILAKAGDTIPQGFIFFWHKNKFHLMVQEDKRLEKMVEAMVKYLRETGKHVTAFLSHALREAFNKLRDEEGVDVTNLEASAGATVDPDGEDLTGDAAESETGDLAEETVPADADDDESGESGEPKEA
jgi:ParB/RepB/Spo0J family partition protein